MPTYIVVDVEADGPYPGDYSMVCFGAVVVEPSLSKTFYGQVQPMKRLVLGAGKDLFKIKIVDTEYEQEALSISGFTREQHLSFPHPSVTMVNFRQWIFENTISGTNPVFISDNPAYDWQWINYYFHSFLKENPFGFSARRIGDLYCGMQFDMSKNNEWKKKFRKTKHTHNPVDDAKGNAEALLAFQEMRLKF